MPSFNVNCIEDWETKVSAIADETLKEDMRLISGIPPWLLMYFDVLLKKSGKSHISEIFTRFSLLVFGGVNFKPYKQKISHQLGKKIDSIEVYPASEGFIAYQDSQTSEGMLLNINSGIFFEFIRIDEVFTESPNRIMLRDVELNMNYAIVVSNNAGLWSYNLGDTIKFVSKNPHRIVVTGRIKHFTSAFGEHVIAEEVEDAMNKACEELNLDVAEFHVAPIVDAGKEDLPHHVWLIEFESGGVDMAELASFLDDYMQQRNTYYRDLRQGNILQQLKIRSIRPSGFADYMKSIGKLGGQNKLPRLSNDRKIADAISIYELKTHA
jgi:hypothetical protein